jgi:hypothetical protein
MKNKALLTLILFLAPAHLFSMNRKSGMEIIGDKKHAAEEFAKELVINYLRGNVHLNSYNDWNEIRKSENHGLKRGNCLKQVYETLKSPSISKESKESIVKGLCKQMNITEKSFDEYLKEK